MLVDAHAHLDQYGSSWPEVLEEIRERWQWLEGVLGRPSLLPRVLDRLAEVRGVARERKEEIVAANASRVLEFGAPGCPCLTG